MLQKRDWAGRLPVYGSLGEIGGERDQGKERKERG